MSVCHASKWIVSFFMAFYLMGCSAQPQHNTNQLNDNILSDNISSVTKGKSNEINNPIKKNKLNNNNSIDNNSTAEKQDILPQQMLLNVPLIKQNPELRNGCEVTSLAMVLQYAGIQVNKMELANKLKKDVDPIVRSKTGDIVSWGNPRHGFVGDITGKSKGYAVYVEPVKALMNQYLPQRTVNLSGTTLDALKKQISDGKPVVVWATGYFKHPIQWETWKHGSETIDATFDLHAVVVVGYDSNSIFINDPLTGKKAKRIGQQTFIRSWNELGKQALSYR